MAKDAIHDSIKNALTKDGWAITAEFLQIEYEELEIFADLVAEREPIVAEKQGKRIIVEVKTFAGRSFIRELQQALGQYDLYVDIITLASWITICTLPSVRRFMKRSFCAKARMRLFNAAT